VAVPDYQNRTSSDPKIYVSILSTGQSIRSWWRSIVLVIVKTAKRRRVPGVWRTIATGPLED